MNFEMHKVNWTRVADQPPKVGTKVYVVDTEDSPPNRIKWAMLRGITADSTELSELYWTFSSDKYQNVVIPATETDRISHWCLREDDNGDFYAEDDLVLPDGVGQMECNLMVPYFILINGQESKTEYFDLTGVGSIDENTARRLVNTDIDGYWEDSSDEFVSLVNTIRHLVYSSMQQSKGVPRSAIKLMYPIFKDDYCERVGDGSGKTE